MKNNKLKLIGLVAAIIITFWLGMYYGKGNQEITYGKETGLPKNCRGIISANIDGWRLGNYTADGALDSIDRNCGRYGYSWSNR